MTRSASLATSIVVAIALALPATATGQAAERRRSGGSSASRPASSPSSPAPARVRTAAPASQPAPSTSQVASRTRGTTGTSGAGAASEASFDSGGRSRGVRAAQSTARPRPPYSGPGPNSNWYYYPSAHPSYVGYYPGYYGSPGYGFHFSVGFGYGYGYGYSPYWYTPHYGLYPYDPFFYGYAPYYYPPAGYGFYSSYQSSGSNAGDRDDGYRPEVQPPTGSLRLRVSLTTAKVYLDGALAGSVDDFDGLTGHLKVEAGTHEIELRADGYQPYATSVTIDAGKTRTERATLRRTRLAAASQRASTAAHRLQ